MTWNWQQADWPNFSYSPEAIWPYEREFLSQSGELAGICRHVGQNDMDQLTIDIISSEAVETSKIEGEILISAENYIAIAQTSRATATRDLQDLVEIGALTKTGELRYTRYRLNLRHEKIGLSP